ncbi:hypothetical protein H1S01_03265 [Heliobacterium chlorum]|uniref:Uncharacterized protein n=1 Tax=Heliobacterium chlorum TaxID=2698 RepID=A0ABR7T1X2_HELCL|nr:hypothetical protein [Heliobacterium chlorum]MBC9783531.1 hypothetical protein [Heliobacterium chlorum]
MELNMLREFNLVSEQFERGQYNLGIISSLIVKIRRFNKSLTPEQAQILLEIPKNVLQNDVTLKDDEGKWARTNAGYFSGNMTQTKDPFIREMKAKFSSGNYELADIARLTEYTQKNFKKLEVEFILRNPEVTLRDDVELIPGSSFLQSGRVFAAVINKALSI